MSFTRPSRINVVLNTWRVHGLVKGVRMIRQLEVLFACCCFGGIFVVVVVCCFIYVYRLIGQSCCAGHNWAIWVVCQGQ